VITVVQTDTARGQMQAELQAPFRKGKMGMSVVLNPLTAYKVRVDGAATRTITSDRWGYLDLTIALHQGKSVVVEVLHQR